MYSTVIEESKRTWIMGEVRNSETSAILDGVPISGDVYQRSVYSR